MKRKKTEITFTEKIGTLINIKEKPSFQLFVSLIYVGENEKKKQQQHWVTTYCH